MVLLVLGREQIRHEQIVRLIQVELEVFDANVREITRWVDVEPFGLLVQVDVLSKGHHHAQTPRGVYLVLMRLGQQRLA
jgi:hypothetical protein